jgi:hypothetical protein
MADGDSTPLERVLLVEGEDDKHVVLQLCIRLNFEPEFWILNKDGIDNVLSSISPEIKAEGRKSVGILVDANDDISNRWAKVTERLRSTGLELPTISSPEGTIIEGLPRVGIWLMPDNESPGELEDFVQTMIPTGDPVWPRSQRYVDDIPEEHRRFRPGKVLRSQLHAWLATRRLPGRMGAAIEAEDLDINVESSAKFIAWLQKLFN